MTINDFKNLDKHHILEMLGIEKPITSRVLGTIGLVAIGALAGATVALLLAPKTGREFRESVARGAKQTAEDLVNAARAKVGNHEAERA